MILYNTKNKYVIMLSVFKMTAQCSITEILVQLIDLAKCT